MTDIFDDTIQEVHENKEAAAASETPDATSEVIPSEGQSDQSADPTPETQAPDPSVEPQQAAGEGAREGEGVESQATTEPELVITGHENVEELLKRDGVAAKFMRRTLPLIKQAGGMPLFRAGAEIVAVGNDPAATGEDIGRAIASAVGPSRWEELRTGIVESALSAKDLSQERFTALVQKASPFIWRAVDAYPDQIVKGLLGDETATVAEVREALSDYRSWKGEPGQAEAADPDDLSGLDPALRREIEESRELRKKFPELEREVSSFRAERQTQQQQQRERQVTELGQELYDSVFSVVTQRVNNLGLEPKPSDTPRIRGIKATLRDKLAQERLEAVFESDKERKGLSQKAIDKVQRLEREGAFAYGDTLAVMAEKTLAEVLESEEVRSLLEALKSETLAQSTPKDPSARAEMVAGAPAALNPADRWSQLEGEDPFDVGVRLARDRVAARG